MGFYRASRGIASPSGEYAPTITAREYVSGLAEAQDALVGAWGSRCRRCRAAARLIADGQPGPAIEALRGVLRRTPGHQHARCLLALAHLGRGDDRSAVRELEIAFDVSHRRLTSVGGLGEGLRRRCEATLLRLLLLRLRVRVQRLDAARTLLGDGPPAA